MLSYILQCEIVELKTKDKVRPSYVSTGLCPLSSVGGLGTIVIFITVLSAVT